MMSPARPVLRFKNVCKSYGSLSLIKDLSFEVPYGMIVGIVGANGSGKTSLIRILAKYMACDSGQIESPEPSRISVVIPSANGFFDQLSVQENLVAFDCDKKKVADLINDFGDQQSLLKEKFSNLSLGQKAIAHFFRGFCQSNIDYLVVDEVVAHLDQEIKRKIFFKLKEFKNSGVGILVTAQNKEQLEGLADRYVAL